MKSLIVKDSPNRIQIIDGLRGLSILLMVAYHFGYDLVIFVGVSPQLIHNPVLDVLQSFFAGLFILMSGISCRFSKSNLKRGLLMLPVAAAIALVTWSIGFPVWFGIIHFLGISAILFSIVSPAIDKISRPVQFIIYIVLFLCSIQFTGRRYDVSWLWWLGFRPEGWSSADYFPLIPWFFIYLLGTLVGTYITENRLPRRFYAQRVPFFAAIGRNTMLIYVLHQPVLYVITLMIKGIINAIQ
jgi:uncharacterized membrane protein